ncbi:Pantothenate synthetase [Paraliobacillus sp. PM-2]|uniref:pantoate--beta-alanine ligase n=1 Tax=Paraliobacillus sp. PM-2 TaxID=1462524 RepID=UPI00061CAA9C|nr:pantoate--beta-alanine ligase [Paraliobacillus sp. PM-2]CQR46670.1 Pantothenate synthetase [Paraliobacillus sp. PM-2]
MQVIKTIQEMQQTVKKIKQKQSTIGFVPTMGYLHEGHTALVDQARKQNSIVIMSIFVNPLQFGPNEDFDKYPRDEMRDMKIAEEHGVDYLFLPTVDEMYPNKLGVNMTVIDRVDVLCGKSRPGHFSGVVTVLTKLFHVTQPDHVYFGRKDAQQVAVIDQMIKDLNFPLTLHMVPTVREKDGLAKSSRNVYLTESEREEAVQLYHSLHLAQKKIFDGENNPAIIVNEVKKYIQSNTSGAIDYVEILTFPTLQPMDLINQQFIIAIAVQFDKARLIDNLIMSADGKIDHITL